MGIPKKGSRRLAVNNRKFRYLVKETHVPGHLDQKELSVTVQEDVDKPGNVLQFRSTYSFPVTGSLVAEMVLEALKEGWNPSTRGPAHILKQASP